MVQAKTDSTDRSQMFYWQVDRPFDERQIKEVFLDRHQAFDHKLVAAMIESGMHQVGKTAAQAKVVELSEPIKSGSVNIVCPATLADATNVVIRIHPKEVRNGYFWSESVAADAAREAGVPTYHTFFIDDTRKNFDYDYMLIELLPGSNMKLGGPFSPKSDARLIAETGRFLARIHTVKTKNYGFFDNNIAKKDRLLVGIHKKWRDHYFAAFVANLDYLTSNSVISAQDRVSIEKIISKHASLINCESPRLVQNDLADWNELTDGKHITGILDWDECYSGDPVADFSAWSVFYPLERMEHLKRGYKSVNSLPEGFEEKLHIYRLRYIVSKMVVRKKKLVFQKSYFVQQLLDYAQKILQYEFRWYGIK